MDKKLSVPMNIWLSEKQRVIYRSFNDLSYALSMRCKLIIISP